MLKDKVIIITGGCGLLGQEVARAACSQGANVIIGDVDNETGCQLEKSLGTSLTFFELDTTCDNSIKRFIRNVDEKFSKIDGAIHSAYPRSSAWGTSFENLKPEFLKEDLFNQLGGAILFSQQILKYFQTQKNGVLIHISSIQGVMAPKFNHYIGTEMSSPIEYSAIKAGVLNMVRYLSKYYKGYNIRVNAISLGGILDNQPQSFLKNYRLDCNNKGMLDPIDIVGTALFLLSDMSEYINGQNLIVDDGWTL
ncbi:MAG: oxidoreductase [Candidatus Margulisiibacteriota bacterium]